MPIPQARPRCRLKILRGGKYANETQEAANERQRVDAISEYNARQLSGSRLSTSITRDDDGRCWLRIVGPKVHPVGAPEKVRSLRAADRATFDALLRGTPGARTYTSQGGYHCAYLPIPADLYASIPLYSEDAQP